MTAFEYRLYLVTDQRACLGKDFFKVAEAAVKGGVDLVQIREKDLDVEAFLDKTIKLRELLDRYHVPLIVNDSLEVAMEAGVSGIHVGNSDTTPAAIREQWPDCSILGYSLEEISQLQSPHAALADYIALSPVFSTPTKTNTIIEWGLEGIARVRSLSSKPLVAIGHIDQYNAKDIIRAGANCLAVVSAICGAADPEKAAAILRNEIEKAN